MIYLYIHNIYYILYIHNYLYIQNFNWICYDNIQNDCDNNFQDYSESRYAKVYSRIDWSYL